MTEIDNIGDIYRLRDEPWIPPADLPKTLLERLPGHSVPLQAVIEVLAFGSSPPSPGASILWFAAQRHRAGKALVAAAHEQKIDLYGTPQTGGSRQLIPSHEFDVPMVLSSEANGIELDLDAVSDDRFFEERRRAVASGGRPLWRDVYVNRKSLIKWLDGLCSDKRRMAKASGIRACVKWLIDERRRGAQERTKESYKEAAMSLFGVGPDQFKTAWKQAALEEPKKDWGKAGAPRKEKIGRKKSFV
jgi:hypothetical protein